MKTRTLWMVLLVPVMSKIKQEAGFWVQRPATWNMCLQIKFHKQNIFLSIEQGKEGEEKTPRGVVKAMRVANRTALGAQLCHSVVGGLRAWHVTSLSLGFLTSFRQQ